MSTFDAGIGQISGELNSYLVYELILYAVRSFSGIPARLLCGRIALFPTASTEILCAFL
jgi:hypothetical protein